MKDISYKGGTTMNCKNKIDKKATGHRLYRLIEESKMTYAEIAEYLDLQSPRVIYEWVSGKKLPSTENLYVSSENGRYPPRLRVSSFFEPLVHW